MQPIELNQENFEREIKAAPQRPALVDFWADWCGPCRALGPTIEEIAEEYAGKLFVGKVNVDAQPELAEQFGVSTIPSVVLFKQGQEVDRIIGNNPRRRYDESIAQLL